MASLDDDPATPAPGRPVILEPTPAGLWPVILGVVIALLAPLFGFLIGSGLDGRDSALSPLQLGLIAGIVVGAGGVVVALAGARRLYGTWRAGQDG